MCTSEIIIYYCKNRLTCRKRVAVGHGWIHCRKRELCRQGLGQYYGDTRISISDEQCTACAMIERQKERDLRIEAWLEDQYELQRQRVMESATKSTIEDANKVYEREGHE